MRALAQHDDRATWGEKEEKYLRTRKYFLWHNWVGLDHDPTTTTRLEHFRQMFTFSLLTRISFHFFFISNFVCFSPISGFFHDFHLQKRTKMRRSLSPRSLAQHFDELKLIVCNERTLSASQTVFVNIFFFFLFSLNFPLPLLFHPFNYRELRTSISVGWRNDLHQRRGVIWMNSWYNTWVDVRQ